MAQEQYVTVATMAELFDARALKELGSDTSSTPLTTLDQNATIIVAAIKAASAEIEAAAVRGGRYSIADLVVLLAADDYMLQSLAARRAFVWLHERRGGALPEVVRDMRDDVQRQLAMLQNGDRVFPQSDEAIGAGQMRVSRMTSQQRQDLALASDRRVYPPSRTRIV